MDPAVITPHDRKTARKRMFVHVTNIVIMNSYFTTRTSKTFRDTSVLAGARLKTVACLPKAILQKLWQSAKKSNTLCLSGAAQTLGIRSEIPLVMPFPGPGPRPFR